MWPNLVPAAAEDRPADLDAAHWLAPLRAAGGAVVKADRQAEAFLLYDVSVNYTPPLKLKRAGGLLQAVNAGAAPLHDLTMYKQQAGVWSHA